MTGLDATAAPEGRPFGRYLIRRRLARGGMGEVFLADQLGPAGPVRPVALKRALPGLSREARTAALFLREMATAAQLNHPNIATTYDFGEIEGQYFLAMEYVEGLTLRQLLERHGPLPVPAALHVALRLAAALEHAHARRNAAGLAEPVVHRDVSPQNVMISTSGQVKLLDFGIAQAGADTVAMARAAGKLAYAAPEQLAGESCDRRVDLWALGALLFEMLTGAQPWLMTSREQALQVTRSGQRVAVGTLRPEAARLEPLIARALMPSRDARWPTAQALADAIRSNHGAWLPSDETSLARLVVDAGGSDAFGPIASLGNPEPTGTGLPGLAALPMLAIGGPEHKTVMLRRPPEIAGASLTPPPLPTDPRLESPPLPTDPRVEPPSFDPPEAVAFDPAVFPAFHEDAQAETTIAVPPRGSTSTAAPRAQPRPPTITPMLGTEGTATLPLARSPIAEPEPAARRWPRGASLAVVGLVLGFVAVLAFVGSPARDERPTPLDVVEAPPELSPAPSQTAQPSARVDPLDEAAPPDATPSASAEPSPDPGTIPPPRPAVQAGEPADPPSAARAREPARRRAPARNTEAPSRTGELAVRTTPWSRVLADGRDLGPTPLVHVTLPAGPHTLNLVPGDPALTPTSMRVTIQAGRATKVFFDFASGRKQVDAPVELEARP